MKLTTKRNQEAKASKVIIFSSERVGRTFQENCKKYRECNVLLDRAGIKFSIGTGCYKGNKENSFICLPVNKEQEITITLLAYRYDQESMLIRNGEGVFLEFMEDARIEKIGNDLVAVSEIEASFHDAYTRVNGRYFIVK